MLIFHANLIGNRILNGSKTLKTSNREKRYRNRSSIKKSRFTVAINPDQFILFHAKVVKAFMFSACYTEVSLHW